MTLLDGVVDGGLCRRCQALPARGEGGICVPCVEDDTPTILAAIARAGREAVAAGNWARADFLRATYVRLNPRGNRGGSG